MEQLSLFVDLEAPADAGGRVTYYQRDVVFFGIRLPELGRQVAEVHRRLASTHRLTGIPYQPSRLHVSLLRAGDYSRLGREAIDALRQAAARVAFSPFPISFETVVSYDGNAGRHERRPVVFPVADGAGEIIALARDIEAELHGRRIDGQAPPSPHLTLLRDCVRIPLTALDPPFGARVTGFELILSHRQERRYATLWP